MPGLVIAAVRDLDPPAGGAEMSLATLLKGVSKPGPLLDEDVLYIPCHQSPNIDPAALTVPKQRTREPLFNFSFCWLLK